MRFIAALLTMLVTSTVAMAAQPADEAAMCAELAPKAQSSAVEARAFEKSAAIVRMTPDMPYEKWFDGPELEAVRQLAEVYGPLMPMVDAYASRMEILARVMQSCADEN